MANTANLQQLRDDVEAEAFALFNMRAPVWVWNDGHVFNGPPDGTVTLDLSGFAAIRAGAILWNGQLMLNGQALTENDVYLMASLHLGLDKPDTDSLFSGGWIPLRTWKTIEKEPTLRQLDDVIATGRVHPNMYSLLVPRG